ncbi:hypothetical protein [Microbacterium testaceum]|uniref:hypothetical protein n=1 Tax=Microbacterium testaceum TaxID=2033 RepID=UPI000B9C3158|nr:hypothetical protein [Microbacterium testaceum]OZD55587.1 hypothetical protein CH252_06950 [Rhodococcus sp. 06-1477-1B]
MSERAEHKGWNAHAQEALDFAKKHGPNMTPEQRERYEAMIAGVERAADRHDATRSSEPGD